MGGLNWLLWAVYHLSLRSAEKKLIFLLTQYIEFIEAMLYIIYQRIAGHSRSQSSAGLSRDSFKSEAQTPASHGLLMLVLMCQTSHVFLARVAEVFLLTNHHLDVKVKDLWDTFSSLDWCKIRLMQAIKFSCEDTIEQCFHTQLGTHLDMSLVWEGLWSSQLSWSSELYL